nr:MAG TPA: hypothetical protein [Caudoviricetes sp.]
MKIYDLRKKDGTPILPYIHEREIWAQGDEPLMDTLHNISKKVNTLEHSTPDVFQPYYKSITNGDPFFNKYNWKSGAGNKPYLKNTIVKHKGMWYLTTDRVSSSIEPSKKSWYFYQIDRSPAPICFLRDDGNNITSDYGYTYDDLSQMLANNDYSRYIKDNDYIELTIDGYKYTMRFNIDVYYDYSRGNPYTDNKSKLDKAIPHHIDMISDEIMPVSDSQFLNPNHPYFDTKSIDSFTGDQKSNDAGIPNVYQEISKPVWEKYSKKLNTILKRHMVQKYAIFGNRRVSNKARSIDNRTTIPIGYLWQPREPEIFGYPVLSSPEYESAVCIQYPCFREFGSKKNIAKVKNDPKSPTPDSYVAWSLQYNSEIPIIINNKGIPQASNKLPSDVKQLLCFRFM